MENKVSIGKNIFAFVLSIVFFFTYLISLYVLPIELVFLNTSNYLSIINEPENQNQYPSIISKILLAHLFPGNDPYPYPKLLLNADGMKVTFEAYIPADWSTGFVQQFFEKGLNYFNFRIPDASFSFDIRQLKTSLIQNSRGISSDYLLTLPRCSKLTDEEIERLLALRDIYQLPACRPANNMIPLFIDSGALYLENHLNTLPSSLPASEILWVNDPLKTNQFFNYSIIRWILRLLPIIAIGLLIAISQLLRQDKRILLLWIGRLLVITSITGLVGILVIIVGFDQITLWIVNYFLQNLIEEFGILLLQIFQQVGMRTMIWVLVSGIIGLIFGIVLLFATKLVKPTNPNSNSSLEKNQDSEVAYTATDTANDEVLLQKEITPETLEEIEEKEKLKKGKRNRKN